MRGDSLKSEQMFYFQNFLAQSAMVVLFWPTIALVVFRISPHERLVSDAGEAAEGEDVPYQAL